MTLILVIFTQVQDTYLKVKVTFKQVLKKAYRNVAKDSAVDKFSRLNLASWVYDLEKYPSIILDHCEFII